MQGRVDAFTFVFQPGGLFALLSAPAEELTNNDFDGEAVLGRRFGELRRRMGEVSLFADRMRIANHYLSARLSGPESVGVIPPSRSARTYERWMCPSV